MVTVPGNRDPSPDGAESTTAPGASPPPRAAWSPAAPGEELDPYAHPDDPYPFYAWARAERPVFYNSRLNMWFVTRYDDIVTVLRDPRTFSSSDPFPTPPGRESKGTLPTRPDDSAGPQAPPEGAGGPLRTIFGQLRGAVPT